MFDPIVCVVAVIFRWGVIRTTPNEMFDLIVCVVAVIFRWASSEPPQTKIVTSSSASSRSSSVEAPPSAGAPSPIAGAAANARTCMPVGWEAIVYVKMNKASLGRRAKHAGCGRVR
jgi:hypothetical protein